MFPVPQTEEHGRKDRSLEIVWGQGRAGGTHGEELHWPSRGHRVGLAFPGDTVLRPELFI